MSILNAIPTSTDTCPSRRVIAPVVVRLRAETGDAGAPDDERTALHEAAHAVIGRAMRLACGGAGMRAAGTKVGFAEIDPPWLGWRREHGSKSRLSEAYVVAIFAGAEAERRAYGASDGGEWQDEMDAETAMSFVRVKGCIAVGDAAWQQQTERLRRRSGRLVAQHWPTILAVAALMLQDRILSAEAIDALCSSELLQP